MATDTQIGVVDQIAAGSSNTKGVDVQQLTTQSWGTAYRQSVVLGDPNNILGLSPVDFVGGVTTSEATVVSVNPIAGASVLIGNDATAPIPVAGQVNSALVGARGYPIDVGQAAMANSLPVTVASDQGPVRFILVDPNSGVGAPVAPTGQLIAASDGAVATLGSTQDTAVFGNSPGSAAAQLRGINDRITTLNETSRQVVDLLSAVLAALNNIALAQGAPLTVSPLTSQLALQ